MKIILVPILTEEYKIRVVVGTPEELAKYLKPYLPDYDYERELEHIKTTRGTAWNLLPEVHPLILLDINLPYELALATLPHEASHAIGYIFKHLGIEDPSDEIRGHAISAVVRVTLKKLLDKKKLYAK